MWTCSHSVAIIMWQPILSLPVGRSYGLSRHGNSLVAAQGKEVIIVDREQHSLVRIKGFQNAVGVHVSGDSLIISDAAKHMVYMYKELSTEWECTNIFGGKRGHTDGKMVELDEPVGIYSLGRIIYCCCYGGQHSGRVVMITPTVFARRFTKWCLDLYTAAQYVPSDKQHDYVWRSNNKVTYVESVQIFERVSNEIDHRIKDCDGFWSEKIGT